MKFIVSKEIFDDIPNAIFGVIVARGIDNHKSYDWIKDMLDESIDDCKKFYEGKVVKESAPITYYRDAFRALGINPK